MAQLLTVRVSLLVMLKVFTSKLLPLNAATHSQLTNGGPASVDELDDDTAIDELDMATRLLDAGAMLLEDGITLLEDITTDELSIMALDTAELETLDTELGATLEGGVWLDTGTELELVAVLELVVSLATQADNTTADKTSAPTRQHSRAASGVKRCCVNISPRSPLGAINYCWYRNLNDGNAIVC